MGSHKTFTLGKYFIKCNSNKIKEVKHQGQEPTLDKYNVEIVEWLDVLQSKFNSGTVLYSTA